MSSSQPLEDRIRAGDGEALGEYCIRQQTQLKAFCDRKLGNALRTKIEIDDILQDAQTEAFRRVVQHQVPDRDLFGWLCHIIEQKIIDAHRRYFEASKRSATREISIDNPIDQEDGRGHNFVNILALTLTTPSQAFSRNVKEQRMRSALEQLPPEHQEVLRLRFTENLSSKEIAERTGRTDAATRVLLTRCLQRLQQWLGEE